eukprot:5614134-Amphidinium_carterae.1
MVGEASKERRLMGRLAIQCARSYAGGAACCNLQRSCHRAQTHTWLDPPGVCHGHTLHEVGAQTS